MSTIKTINIQHPSSASVNLALTSGGATTVNGVFTLPAVDGANGQALITNGAGTVSYQTAKSAFIEVFTSSTTWTVPDGVRNVKVIVVGGGGGGGGTNNTGSSVGSGGGAGGVAIKSVAVTPASTISITVGAAGTAASNAVGGTGGTSSFGSHCSATGGTGGGRNSPPTFQASAANGSGSSGDINLSGNQKVSPAHSVDIATGSPSAWSSVEGADTPLGLGFGGRSRPYGTNAAGLAGSGYGAGGSGGMTVGTNQAGGAGAPGIVIVEY